jgi:two-component system sensor histidine kinase LytS
MRGAKLKAVFRIDRAATRMTVPPMSVHTLIENAVKHGKRMKNKVLTIQVIARKSRDKKLTIQVIQPGRLKKVRPHKAGAGLLLARQQLDLLFQKKGQINLTEDRSGHVTATLEIPINRKDS